MEILTVGEFKSLLAGLSTAAQSLSQKLHKQNATGIVVEIDPARGGFCSSRFSSNCLTEDTTVKISDFVNAMTDMLQWTDDVGGLFEGVDDDRPLGA